MKALYICVVVMMSVAPGCAHRGAEVPAAKELTFERVEKIPLGSSQQVLSDAFGRPRYVDGPYPGQGTIQWFYGKGDYSSSGFIMDAASTRVLSKIWNVMEGDAERSLSVVLARYPDAHFTQKESKFINPHKGRPTELWYEDRAKGLFIEVQKKTNEVESIIWCSTHAAQTIANCFKTNKDRDAR